MLLAGILTGYVMEFFGRSVAGLWTIESAPNYIEIFPSILFGYGLPIMMYYSCYRVFLSSIGKKTGQFGVKIAGKRMERWLMKDAGFAGATLIVIPVLLMPAIEYFDPISKGFVFAFTLLGMWFLLEYVEYKRHERTLLMDILEGKWLQPTAIAISAVVTGLVWEAANLLKPSWTYMNLPLMELQMAGVPLAVLVGWIPLYIIYLSFYRVIIKGRDKLW